MSALWMNIRFFLRRDEVFRAVDKHIGLGRFLKALAIALGATALFTLLGGCVSGGAIMETRAGGSLTPNCIITTSTAGIPFIYSRTTTASAGECRAQSAGRPYYFSGGSSRRYPDDSGYDPGGRATLHYWAPYFPPGGAGTGCYDWRGQPALCR